MRVFRYDRSFDGLLSAVFDAYTRKDFPELLLGPGDIVPLTAASIHAVETEQHKVDRVFRGLDKRLTREARRGLLYAWLSEQPESDSLLFRYIRKTFDRQRAETDLSDKDVLAVINLARQVGKEVERVMGFARFQKTREGIYFAAAAPRHDVLTLVLDHFADRFADQDWILFDLKRAYGFLHQGGQFHDVTLDEGRLHRLRQEHGKLDPELLAENEPLFQELWKSYFKAAAIPQRRNPALQSRCMPRRYWPYMTEKQE